MWLLSAHIVLVSDSETELKWLWTKPTNMCPLHSLPTLRSALISTQCCIKGGAGNQQRPDIAHHKHRDVIKAYTCSKFTTSDADIGSQTLCRHNCIFEEATLNTQWYFDDVTFQGTWRSLSANADVLHAYVFRLLQEKCHIHDQFAMTVHFIIVRWHTSCHRTVKSPVEFCVFWNKPVNVLHAIIR